RPRRAASAAVLEVAAGRITLFTPGRSAEAGRPGLGLCGSSYRLPDPGLRRAPCSMLSGLSSRTAGAMQAAALPPSHQRVYLRYGAAPGPANTGVLTCRRPLRNRRGRLEQAMLVPTRSQVVRPSVLRTA